MNTNKYNSTLKQLNKPVKTMKIFKNYLAIIVLLVVTGFGASAQTTYQNWTALPDSPTHLEVSWSTSKCIPILGADEIRLNVFNESGAARTADFTLTISDAGQTDVIYVVSGLSLTAGKSIQADCGETVPPELIIPVPAGFNPSTLTISISYQS